MKYGRHYSTPKKNNNRSANTNSLLKDLFIYFLADTSSAEALLSLEVEVRLYLQRLPMQPDCRQRVVQNAQGNFTLSHSINVLCDKLKAN